MSDLTEKEKKDLKIIVAEYLLPAIMSSMQEYSKRVFDFMEKQKTKSINDYEEFEKIVERLKKAEEDIGELKKGIGRELLNIAKKK